MTDKMKEMLPCPFCGGAPAVCDDTSYGNATVFCPDRHDCPVKPVADADLRAGETVEDAKRRWNTRQPTTPVGDAGLRAEQRELLADLAAYYRWRSSEGALDLRDYCGRVADALAALSGSQGGEIAID